MTACSSGAASADPDGAEAEALEAGATDFLTKPADAVEIRARVTNLLALSAAHRAQRGMAASPRERTMKRIRSKLDLATP